MAEDRDNCVYVAEADAKAVAKAIRRRWILALSPAFIALPALILAMVIARLDDHPRSISDILQRLLITVVVFGGLACYLMIGPFRIRKTAVMIGGDFIVAPLVASPNHVTTVKFEDMTRVRVSLSQDRIVGATIAAKGRRVCTRWIKDPGLVVRAILERAPEAVRWRRAWHPFERLSRERVKELIEKANIPDIYNLPLFSGEYTRADDLVSSQVPMPGIRGRLERLLGGGACKTMTICSPQIPTPVSRYVDLLLFQMFKTSVSTRVLRRSEPLPTVTAGTDTIETPPLANVLDRLKAMCGLDPRTDRARTEAAMHVTFADSRSGSVIPFRVYCQFDFQSDTCCQIRMERATE